MKIYWLILSLLALLVSSCSCLENQDACEADTPVEQEPTPDAAEDVDEATNVEDTGQAIAIARVEEELSLVRETIASYERKLEALSSLRVLLDGWADLDPTARDKLQSIANTLRDKPKPTPLSREQDYQRHAQSIPGFLFDDFFSKKISLPLSRENPRAVLSVPLKNRNARNIAMKKGYMDNSLMLFAELKEGSIHFTDVVSGISLGSGQVLFNAKDFGAVRLMAFSQIGNPFLYIANEHGLVLRFNMTVVFYGTRLTGTARELEERTRQIEKPGVESNDNEVADEVDERPTILVALSLHSRTSLCHDDLTAEDSRDLKFSLRLCQDVQQIELLTLRRSTCLGSYADGKLRVHKQDLTLWSAASPDHAVTAIASSNNLIAFASGGNVYTASPAALEPSRKPCQFFSNAPITSLAYDVIIPSFLYVGVGGTSEEPGQVVVLNGRARSESSTIVCKQVSKLAVQRAVESSTKVPLLPVNVKTLTGYLVVSISNALVVYNTTGVLRKVPEFLFSTGDVVDTKDNVVLLETIRRAEEPRTTSYSVLSCDESKCTVYDSLLPYSELKADIGWVRGPILFGAAVVIFIWQFLRNRAKASNTSPGFPGMRGNMDADLQRFLNEAKAFKSETAGRRGAANFPRRAFAGMDRAPSPQTDLLSQMSNLSE